MREIYYLLKNILITKPIFEVKEFNSIKVIFILFLAFFNLTAFTQIIPSSTDLSYLTNPNSDIHLAHKVISTSNKKWVILNVLANNQVILDSLLFTYSFTDNLDEPINNFNEVGLKNYELYESPINKMYAFEPTNNTYKYLILRALHATTHKTYSYIINLEKISSFFITKIDYTIPILSGYSIKGSSIKLAKLEGGHANFKAKFISTDFSTAMPPMANIKINTSFDNVDTTFIITNGNTLASDKEGVYSIFEENNEKTISFFRIANTRYPQFSDIKEIINASIYLFTKKEKETLTNSIEPKKSYDAFWLENTNSAERASKMISAYFSRVKEANTLFTTYKEGWKTDMGMIYIIFGPPNKVFRSNGSFLWVYEKTYEMPSLQFEFYLKSKNSDSEYFELERNIKYQNTWFRAIDLWRKGRKNL